jgi:hypothetical protein
LLLLETSWRTICKLWEPIEKFLKIDMNTIRTFWELDENTKINEK